MYICVNARDCTYDVNDYFSVTDLINLKIKKSLKTAIELLRFFLEIITGGVYKLFMCSGHKILVCTEKLTATILRQFFFCGRIVILTYHSCI